MKFENEEPIDDELVVLDLLCKRWADYTTREINRRFRRQQPYVEIGQHHEHADSSFKRYLVTDRVADALLAEGLVCGKPEWGYTDMKILRASEAGKIRLFEVRRRHEMDEQLCAYWWFEDVHG